MMYCESYKELLRSRKGMPRQYLRRKAINLLELSQSILHGFHPKPCIHFLYFHHMFQDELVNAERLIDFLSKYYKFISYSAAVNLLKTNKIDDSYICFSSDDGLKNNLIAANLFRTHGIKACFFINPSIIGRGDHSVNAKFSRERLNMPPVEFLNWSEVDKLLNMEQEIGDHSWAHQNMAQLSREEIECDLSKSREFLESKVGAIRHFAYPYGQFSFFSEAALEVVMSLNYHSCASAERGSHIPVDVPIAPNKLCIRRDVIEFGAPIKESLYFVGRAILRSKSSNSLWPWFA